MTPPSNELRIQHQEHDIENIIEFFVKGFKPKAGEQITNWEWLYDPHKGRVAFKLYITAILNQGRAKQEKELGEPEATP